MVMMRLLQKKIVFDVWTEISVNPELVRRLHDKALVLRMLQRAREVPKWFETLKFSETSYYPTWTRCAKALSTGKLEQSL
jgi:hypothetical protein